MTTRDDLVLEHRVSELELELSRMRRQLEKLSIPQTQAPKAEPAPRYTHPHDRATIHQKRSYEFFQKLPPVRKVIDLASTNTATNEVVLTDSYSVTQLTRALQQFSRLQFPNRRTWKGNRWLYGPAKALFAQAGAVVRHPGSRVWSWVIWPHQRRALCAQIVEGLSPKK